MSFETVRRRVGEAAARAGRSPSSVQIVAVTKGRTPEEIMAVYRAGHRDFGENRAQEFIAKAPLLPGDIRWHFVGTLQRNKVIKVRPIVHLLHSLDRTRLARAWVAAEAPVPPALLQINIGRESQKSGVDPDAAAAVADDVVACGVRLQGLMAIAPIGADPAALRRYFRRMARLRDKISAHYPAVVDLSIGMTDDFELAVEEGATIVRVGRAIFGGPPGA